MGAQTCTRGEGHVQMKAEKGGCVCEPRNSKDGQRTPRQPGGRLGAHAAHSHRGPGLGPGIPRF